MLIFWTAAYAFELLATFRPLWYLRRFLNPLVMLSAVASSLLILPLLTLPFKFIMMWLLVFRLINLLRISKGRMHAYYLQYVTRRTSLVLAGMHMSIFVVFSLLLSYMDWENIITLAAVAMTAGAFTLVVSVWRNAVKLPFVEPEAFLADRHLPTVTVAIPARNETRDLEQCIRSILRSDYPKLEIIVLDDCSHDRTSDIIKSFAHDGVRFINGEPPAKRWLAKNQAYQALLKHSTGELVMFIGVDVRVEPVTIRNIVNTMYARRKRMLSVLPLRTKPDARSMFIQPLRYWWELVPPRRLFNRPPVLSTCWVADRNFMLDNGGFTAVSHAILPEVYFARKAVQTDAYSFVRSNEELGLKTVKNFEGQRDTAIRVKYPQLRRRLEYVLILSGLLLAYIFLPIAALVLGWNANPLLLICGMLTYVCLLTVHGTVLAVTDQPGILRGLATLPIAMIGEVALGLMSMYKYEFGTVEWKGRNVCIPAMHVYPKLPALKD